MSGEILKELFVRVAYVVDDQSEKKLTDSTRKAVVQGELIVNAFTAAAKAFGKVLADVAAGLDQMFYASGRIGASAANIRAYSAAVANLGSSVEAGLSSLEAFGKFIRSNPGALNFVASFGVKTTDQNGRQRDTSDILDDFAAKIKAKHGDNYPLQLKFAEMVGVDENTWRALTDPEYQRGKTEKKTFFQKIGLDPDEAKKTGREFMNTMRDIGNIAEVMISKVMANFVKDGDKGLGGLKDWLLAHGGEISEAITSILRVIVKLAEKFYEWAKSKAGEDFEKSVTNIASAIETAANKTAAWVDNLNTLLDRIAKIAEYLPAFHAYKWLFNNLSGNEQKTPTVGVDGKPGLNPKEAAEIYKRAQDGKKGGGFWDGVRSFLGELFGVKGAHAEPSAISKGAGARGGAAKRSAGARGGKDAPAAAGGAHVPPQGAAGGKPNAFFTKENADAVRAAAKELGTTPEDLATVIGYESNFNPSKWGGKGGNYMGLIQFGPSERKQFGVYQGQSFPEQMKAVVAFLKARGFKPGMGILDLYSTILTGSPGHYDRSDGHGTPRTHLAKMMREQAHRARQFLKQGAEEAPAAALAARQPGGMIGLRAAAERLKKLPGISDDNGPPGASGWSRWKESSRRLWLDEYAKGRFGKQPDVDAWLKSHGMSAPQPGTPNPGAQSMNNSTQNISPNTSINISGVSDPHEAARAVERAQARKNRELATLLRNTVGVAS